MSPLIRQLILDRSEVEDYLLLKRTQRGAPSVSFCGPEIHNFGWKDELSLLLRADCGWISFVSPPLRWPFIGLFRQPEVFIIRAQSLCAGAPREGNIT